MIKADVELLADREAIKELTARYARALVQGDGRGVGALYAEDGRFSAGSYHYIGRSAIQDFLAGQVTPLNNIPFVTNYIIAVEGQEATCYSIMFTPWYRDAFPGFCGAYSDRLRKVDGEWFFVERSFEFFKGRPEGV